jgi:hypothetical protein
MSGKFARLQALYVSAGANPFFAAGLRAARGFAAALARGFAAALVRGFAGV